MPREYFDIREDEQFSIKIKEYPCLLICKEKDRVESAWKLINN